MSCSSLIFNIFVSVLQINNTKTCDEKLNGILRKNRGEEFEKSYEPLHGVEGVKNCQNHPYVIMNGP